MRELFIYYRIRADAASAALEAVHAMQARLRHEHAGLAARLLRRPEEKDQQQTWMEIYAFPGGVTPALEARIAHAAAAVEPFITGTRHTEVFIPCAS
jgi:hypothetical protein